MILTLKSMSAEINKSMFCGEIPIKYRSDNKEIGQNSIVYFECVSGDEREKYENLQESDKKDFVSTSAYISIPTINVERLYEMHQLGISYDYIGTLNMIKDVVSVNEDNEKILFAIFLILHEFGHWHDFKSKNEKPYLYTQDEKERKEVHDIKVQIINNQSLREMSKYKIMEQLRRYFKRYNSIPCEKIANDFAISKMKDVCNLFREKGVYI